MPQNEKTPFYPRSPYACAKVYSFWQTVNYREAYGLLPATGFCLITNRPDEAKPLLREKLPVPPRRIKLGLQDKLYLGNLDAKRDWGFAGDFVEAMWLMMQTGQDRMIL